MKHRKGIIFAACIAAYLIFILGSLLLEFGPGQKIGHNFFTFSSDLLRIVPCAFILIGLFEVWVKKETVERHFGQESGVRGFIWGILLAGTSIGGLYVAFPVAASLHRKGARLSVLFTYIGASGICRIPMTVFEASFLGPKFTLVRLLVSLPLLILSSMLLGNFLEKRHYRIEELI